MSLKEYIRKRNLKKSGEPKGSKKSSAKGLAFCVQKHAARSLHYDFRLEHKGVLLSWAVPKGPSMDSKDKRLAIQVEDHPLSYQYFEGIIPPGNYGAGTVEIWDYGFYTLPDVLDRKEIEKNMSAFLKLGHIRLVLHGKKLKGEFILQKLKKEPVDRNWLLIKR
jgi:bifunctional non-homologous end joining protein LigD